MSESKLQINAKTVFDDATDNACPEVSNVFLYKRKTKREKIYLTSLDEDKKHKTSYFLFFFSLIFMAGIGVINSQCDVRTCVMLLTLFVSRHCITILLFLTNKYLNSCYMPEIGKKDIDFLSYKRLLKSIFGL